MGNCVEVIIAKPNEIGPLNVTKCRNWLTVKLENTTCGWCASLLRKWPNDATKLAAAHAELERLLQHACQIDLGIGLSRR